MAKRNRERAKQAKKKAKEERKVQREAEKLQRPGEDIDLLDDASEYTAALSTDVVSPDEAEEDAPPENQ